MATANLNKSEELCIIKQKKNWRDHRKGLKGRISLDADSGPPRYVL